MSRFQATKELDFDDDTHTILGKVCDFVCGAESPPAPEPVTFMERGLAGEIYHPKHRAFELHTTSVIIQQ